MTSQRQTSGVEARSLLKRYPTFKDNKSLPLHAWYSYTEGFSGNFVRSVLSSEFCEPRRILDPFCGSSTTGVESVLLGHKYQGYDINPVMTLVSDVKTRSAFILAKQIKLGTYTLTKLISIAEKISKASAIQKTVSADIFSTRKYFSSKNLLAAHAIRCAAQEIDDRNLSRFMIVALLSVLVRVSYLKRSPDLKYRAEHDRERPCTRVEFLKAATKYLQDLTIVPSKGLGSARQYTGSAKNLQFTKDSQIDLILTSPPYLNGTNYIRNTKLELWIAGFLSDDGDLKSYRKKEISCGINSAQRTSYVPTQWSSINANIEAVREKQYDRRISPMVANYFHDMHEVFVQMHRVLKTGSRCYFVVGDSAFNGVHIPTQKHLSLIGSCVGLSLKHTTHLRARRSRGGMPLSEDVLVFEKGRPQ